MASVGLDSTGRSAQYFAKPLIIVIPCEQAPVLGRKRRFRLFFPNHVRCTWLGLYRHAGSCLKLSIGVRTCTDGSILSIPDERACAITLETAVVDVGQK